MSTANDNDVLHQRAHEYLHTALKAEPWLSYYGLGIPRGGGRWYPRTGKWYSVLRPQLDERRARFESHIDEIAASIEWLDLQVMIKTVNHRHSSYGYKHMVERYFRARERNQYVSNGAFIVAAIGMGFQMKETSLSSPNVLFNISERTVKRTDPAVAELRRNSLCYSSR